MPCPNPRRLVPQLFRYRRSIVTGCLLLAIANTLTTDGVRPTIIKDHLEAAADLAYDRWNSFSRITVSRNQTGPPAMFGASPRMPDLTIEQRALQIDGGAGNGLDSTVTLRNSRLPALWWLPTQTSLMPFRT